jgi:glutamate dehydrogenase
MLDATNKSLRSIFFNEGRYAPTVMVPLDSGKPQPFGVFFIHGRHFNGFHNRFRDIARGGLRIVTPPNSDQHAIESSRQYDEAYGLSYAQQLKNKDIPEGGSKGVCLVDTPSLSPATRFFEARICVRAYTDALLDLIVEPSVKILVDYYGKEELIYLGPDEQIIASDIDWICHRAAQRRLPYPSCIYEFKSRCWY